MKLHNNSVTPRMINNIIMNLDLPEASGPNCIPMVVLKNCESELSHTLELFNKCLKESYFSDCWKVSSVVPVFKNVLQSIVFFLWLVKSLKNLQIIGLLIT